MSDHRLSSGPDQILQEAHDGWQRTRTEDRDDHEDRNDGNHDLNAEHAAPADRSATANGSAAAEHAAPAHTVSNADTELLAATSLFVVGCWVAWTYRQTWWGILLGMVIVFAPMIIARIPRR